MRHEEFESGCEASCNGPYSGYWSKSMVGFDNEHVSFVFELTYNYGVYEYKRGNDLGAILMHKRNANGDDMEAKMLEAFPEASESKVDGVYRLINDDLLFRFVDSQATGAQLIRGVELNTANLAAATDYWMRIGLTQKEDGALTCANYESIFELVLKEAPAIDRGEAFGRLAFSCAEPDVQTVFE